VAIEEFNKFVELLVRLFGIAGLDGVGDAMVQVIAQQNLADATQSLLDGGNLGEDVGAVAVLPDHALEAADLAFNPAQALDQGCLHFGVSVHELYLERNAASRRLLVTTLTELSAMAALAKTGLSAMPKAG
jgi:hypothetical protein